MATSIQSKKGLSPSLSIIVPVYNVERYLCECIDSIIASSFTNFELILVDDGSSDSSSSICDEYAQQDCRIRVFHKANGGPSSARNLGIEMSRSPWITFVDADDLVSPSFFANLYKVLDDCPDVDFVQAGCTNFINGRPSNVEQWYDNYIGDDKSGLLNKIRGLTVSKLFNVDIIHCNGLSFDERLKSAEDLQFTLEYIIHVNQYAFIQETGYYYRRDNNCSLTHTAQDQSYDISLLIFKLRFDVITTYINKYGLKQSMFKIRNEQLASLLIFAITNGLYQYHNINDRLLHLRKDFTKEQLDISRYCEGKMNRIAFFFLRKKFYRLFDLLICYNIKKYS